MPGDYMKLIFILTLPLMAFPCLAQAQSKAEVFHNGEVSSQFMKITESAKASGSGGTDLCDYGSHAIKLSVRTKSGGGEVHAHYDDIFIVTEGKATLITGGTLVNPQTGKDGESKGSSIQNGDTQAIAKGDVVHIPAGVPHQLIIADGETYGSIVVKVKE
jgi:mannose-6-phosphate isomerase-like protein (cupin superfamily)